MLPDDIPKPPWKTITAITAVISLVAGIQLALLLNDIAIQWAKESNFPPGLFTPLAYAAAVIVTLLGFLAATTTAILTAILIGYIKRGRADRPSRNSF